MWFINILLFLVVFVSSHSKCSTTPIRHGAFFVGEESAQMGTSYLDQNTRKLEELPALAILGGDVGEDPRTTADDRTDVHDSRHAHHISIRSASNGNQTGLMENTIKNSIICEHQLNDTFDILLSYPMEESVSCRWNISAPDDFIVTIALTVLKYNNSGLAPADSTGNSCLPNGTRIVFTEFFPDAQPKETAFCEVKSAQIAAFTFTTLSNKVSIDVYTPRNSQIAWALWYQAINESFVEVAYDYVEDVSSGLGIPELSTASYDILEKWSGMSTEQCFEIEGMSIRSKNISFSNNGSCSLTFLPGVDAELMLAFLDVDLSDPFVTNCSNENAFITLRTWKLDGNINETFLCSFHSMGIQFTSPVRIELNYHPSAVTRRNFTAEISVLVPDINMGGAEWLNMLLKNTLIYSLTDERGHLATLGYPSHFPSMRMIWEITVGQGKAINLEFVDIDIGYTPPSTCIETTPILLIMLPQSPLGDKKQIFCGSLPPRNITSTGSKMTIIFNPKAGNVGRGMQAVYTSFDHENNTFRANLDIDVFRLSSELQFPSSMLAAATTIFANCEFLFMKDSGNFTTLNYPFDIPVNYTTCWHILSGPSNFIKSLFKSSPLFNFFYEDDSGIEALTASLTTSLATTLFADGGDHFRGNFDMDGTVALSTEPTVPSTKLTDASLACPYVFTEDNGTFSTSNYPNDYPANYSMCWYISTDPSRFIMLRFRNFSLDSAQVDPCDKAYSFVTVNDFVADAVDLCGTLENQLIKSSSNILKIGIDGRLGQGQGFYAMYETFKIPRFRSHFATGDAGSCNATEHLESLTISGDVRLPALMSKCTVDGNWLEWFTEAEMEMAWIASPLFPGRYPAGSRCMWIVRAQENVIINLNFFDFDLGEAPGTYPPCSDADTFIRIRDCVSREEQILCGIKTQNEQLMIQSNSVEIEFFSESGYGRGFQAFYKLEQSSAEGQQFRVLPEVLTPFPAYKGIPLMTTEEQLLLPQSQMSTSTPEVEEVAMDLSCEDAGSDKCGGSLQSEFGYFSSAFYPEELQIKTNCIWTITSSLRHYQIALKIVDIDLGAPMIDGKCDDRYGYIKVEISGNSAFICSNHGQNLFVSEAGLIKVEFSSELGVGRGFCAAFMSIDSTFNGSITDLKFPCLCENLYTNISWIRPTVTPTEPPSCEFMIGEGSGTLPSESFHIPYPPNLECVWTLSARPGEYVNLRFLSLDLDEFRMSTRRRCLLSDTHVQITLFKDKVLNKRFCSDDDWSVAIPPSRDVTIKFISGDIPDHSHTGFRVAYNFTLTTSSSKVFSQDLAENTSVSESSEDNFGFRVFNDYDGYSSLSSADSPDKEVSVETGRRTTEGDRTRLTWPVEVETEIPDLGLFSDYATEIPDVYGTELPEESKTAMGRVDIEADIVTTASTKRPLRTYSVDELTTRTSTSSTSGVIPGRGQMTAREMELTIYICTALAALLIIVLILVTLYCAKNRRSSSKAGFDVDAADEANYWQTYKDWAKDWVTEPVAGSAQSTVGAMCGDEIGTVPKRLPPSGDAVGADTSELSPGHLKTVSAVINEPPIDKPERGFIQSEKLV